MVPFAGYEMPVQYEGIIAEHLWTRENAGLFDVSHMGQLLVHGRTVDAALETLMPGDFQARERHEAQIFAVARRRWRHRRRSHGDTPRRRFLVVVNGATKYGDIAVMSRRLPEDVVVDHMQEQALLALQGPRAAEVLETIIPGVSELSFMQGAHFIGRAEPVDQPLRLTGEDGFEISVPAVAGTDLADAINRA